MRDLPAFSVNATMIPLRRPVIRTCCPRRQPPRASAHRAVRPATGKVDAAAKLLSLPDAQTWQAWAIFRGHANEVAVDAFLNGKINFPGIWQTVERVMTAHQVIAHPNLQVLIESDAWARQKASEMVEC